MLMMTSSDIINLCRSIFPDLNDWTVKSFTEGSTNNLFGAFSKDNKQIIVIRFFGHSTHLFIDRDSEIHYLKELNRLSLAPRIYKRFPNALVYGFIPGRTLDPLDLSDPKIGR
ncbi:hypothetical protein ACOME3_010098 [Neoechinorhynchus agilis]